MKDTIYFATSNKNKVREAQAILGFPIEIVHLELTEIQSMDVAEIVTAKVQEAYNKLKKPVIVDDVGMHLERWHGFPGPLIKFVEKAGQGSSALTLKMMEGEMNRNVLIRSAIGFHDGKHIHVCIGEVKGTLTTEERGEEGWGFDFVIIPEGETQTFAEMGAEKKNKLSHRYRALTKFKELLTKLNTD